MKNLEQGDEESEESGYRTKPYIAPEQPGLHVGPRFQCPGCGMPAKAKDGELAIEVRAIHGPLIPKACIRRWWWPFGCRVKLVHLHQSCGTCGSKWVVGPVEEA